MTTKAELENKVNELRQVIAISSNFDARDMELTDLASILYDRIDEEISVADHEKSELETRCKFLDDAQMAVTDLQDFLADAERDAS